MQDQTKRKWRAEDLGPRQFKAFERLLLSFGAERNTHIRITGVVGGDESRCKVFAPFGGGPANEAAVEAWHEVGEQFGWAVNRKNLKAVRAAIEAGIAKAAAARPEVDERRTPAEDAELTRIHREHLDEQRERTAKREANHDAIRAKAPAGAVALILAEFDEDKCDPMTDYFAHSTTRTVAIGWRFSQREDFRRLREAAATFPETAHLGPGRDRYQVVLLLSAEECASNHYQLGHAGDLLRDEEGRQAVFTTEAEAVAAAEAAGHPHGYRIEHESVEHRDNYSMGSGNYLKAGFNDSTGWRVRSTPFGGRALPYHEIEDRLPPAPTTAEPAEEREAGGATVSDSESEARSPSAGVEASVSQSEKNPENVEVRFAEKPSAEVRAELKAARFRWSPRFKCWYGRRERLPSRYAATA